MKKKIILTSLLAITAVGCANAQSLLAGWDFANLAPFGPGASWEITPANHGAIAGRANIVTSNFEQLDSLGGSNLATFQVTTNDGTTVGTAGTPFSTGTDDPQALAFFNAGVNGKSFTVEFSTLGVSGLSLQYAIRANAQAANNNQWAWSVDGSNFTNFGAVDQPNASYTQKNYSLTDVSALNGQTKVWLRYTLSGSTASAAVPESALAIDNFRVNATVVPEPAAIAMVLSVVGALCFWNRRRAHA